MLLRHSDSWGAVGLRSNRRVPNTDRRAPRRFCGAWIRPLAFILASSVALARSGHAADPVPNEQALKAVYLFNFSKFVEWPARAFESPQAPFVIGILGTDPFGKLLEAAVEGKTVNGRPIVIKRFENVRALQPAQILYISSSEVATLSDIFKAVKGMPVLTVSDIPLFGALGGVIGFVLEEKKVKLQLNVESAKIADLKISAQLMKVAKPVQKEEATR